MEGKPKSRGGRPRTREPKDGQRITISVRVTPRLKSLVEESAKQSGRSVSQEIEYRVERSFERQDLLLDLLSTAFGQKTAGYMMVMMIAFSEAGRTAGHLADPLGAQLKDWTEDDWAKNEAWKALRKAAEDYFVPGEFDDPIKVPKRGREFKKEIGMSVSEYVAKSLIQEIYGLRPERRYGNIVKDLRRLLDVPQVLVDRAKARWAEAEAAEDAEKGKT